MFSFLMSAMLVGQCGTYPVYSYPPVVTYSTPPVVNYGAPVRIAPVTNIRLEGISVRTRVSKVVKYDSGWQQVPVVNGYVPQIARRTNSDGSKEIIYDYSKRITYESCTKPGDPKKPEPKLEPKPEAPKPEPTTMPTPYRPEPVAPEPQPFSPLPEAPAKAKFEKTPAPEPLPYSPLPEPTKTEAEKDGLRRPSDVTQAEDDRVFVPSYHAR